MISYREFLGVSFSCSVVSCVLDGKGKSLPFGSLKVQALQRARRHLSARNLLIILLKSVRVLFQTTLPGLMLKPVWKALVEKGTLLQLPELGTQSRSLSREQQKASASTCGSKQRASTCGSKRQGHRKHPATFQGRGATGSYPLASPPFWGKA